MTIGIFCSGPNAGLAVFEALRAVERVATGSIGGFAVYGAITAGGRAREFSTARGGSATLFIEGETTGVAGVISSGPDRPQPLDQFLRTDPAAGIVSGHRLPNMTGAGGLPFNEEALAALRAGRTAREAVDAVLDANPEGDVGLIAGDLRGAVHAGNSARVARRSDLGHARRENAGAVVEVLHNAIGPGPSIAAMAPQGGADGWVEIGSGTAVGLGDTARVEVDAAGTATRVVTTDAALIKGERNGAAIYLGAEVRQGDRLLGWTTAEPNAVLKDGRIVSMSGQTHIRLGYRRAG